MLTVLFGATTVICGIGWLNRWVCSAAMVKYILEKGYPEPSAEELGDCCVYVWKKLLHLD